MASDKLIKKLLLAKSQLSYYNIDYYLKDKHIEESSPLLADVLLDAIFTFIEAKYELTKLKYPRKQYWAQKIIVDAANLMSDLIQNIEQVFQK